MVRKIISLLSGIKEVKKIIEALNQYNLTEKVPISLLRESSDNDVFIIGEKDKKIFRISKRLPISDIKFEYEAIRHLLNGGVSVPKIVNTKTGSFYVLVDGRIGVLFDFINGEHIKVDKDHLPTQRQAYNAGRGLGIMSNVAVGFISSSPRKRNIFSEFKRVLVRSKIFIDQFDGGKEFVDQVKDAINFGENNKEIEGFIHNDYRPSNVFFDDNNELVGIIDFDWSCTGPIIKDLALAAVEWSFPDGMIEPDFKVFDSFLEGYNSSSVHKYKKDKKLYSWIKFATLSDASTYFCDLAEDSESTKRIIKSYMYRKYLFFSKLSPDDFAL